MADDCTISLEKIEEVKKEVSDVKQILNGNGTPQSGLVFRVSMLEEHYGGISTKLDKLNDSVERVGKLNGYSEKPFLGIDPKTKDLLVRWFIRGAIGALLGTEIAKNFI